MIDSIVQTLRLFGFYLVIAFLAHLVHLGIGVVDVGFDEVRRQHRSARAQLGWMFSVWILTAGFYPTELEIPHKQIVQCGNCGRRYDEEPDYCGACGNAAFASVSESEAGEGVL